MCNSCTTDKKINHATAKSYDDFVNLHLHTHYSLLDGLSKPENVIQKVASINQKAVAVTEHGNTFSAVKVHKLAEKANIKHIYGMEAYITDDRFVKNKERKYYHITLLAKNEEGRLNLNKLASLGYLEGFYNKPRIDHELLNKYKDGIIVLSGCFLKGTKVETIDGLRSIEDITSGTLVKTIDGSFKKVNYPTSNWYIGNIYNIKTQGSTFDIEATHNHKFLVAKDRDGTLSDIGYNEKIYNSLIENSNTSDFSGKNRGEKAKYKRWSKNKDINWVEAESINVGDWILKPLSENTIDTSLFMDGVKLTDDLLEVLGLYVAEGSVDSTSMNRLNFSINSKDEYSIDKIKDVFINLFGENVSSWNNKNNTCTELCISNKALAKMFSKLFGIGATNKKIPKIIKELPASKQKHFIKGMMLGDGSYRLHNNGHDIRYVTISKQLAYDLSDIFNRFSINPSITKRNGYIKDGVNHKDSYYISITSKTASKFNQFIWKNDELNLSSNDLRDIDIPVEYNGKLYMKHKVVNIEKNEYSGDVYCLSVSENHSFIAEGVVVHNCMGSEIQQSLAGGKIGDGEIHISDENYNRAKHKAKMYQSMLGENYYMEVQAHNDPRQQLLNRKVIDIANELNIRYVATTDSHMVEEIDHELHSIFIQIGTNREAGETYDDTFIMTAKEVYDRLDSLTPDERERAVKESLLIADRCDVKIPLSAPIIPHNKIPLNFDDEVHYLKDLINKGWLARGVHKKSSEEKAIYKQRLNYEMNAIVKMGFEGYFLFVESYANSVRRRGIARGSGGGSLVAYLLQITNIDPIPFNLYFERFIDVSALDDLESGNITKKELKLPDFDLDFSPSERDLVEEGIIKTFSQEKYASIGQFGYIRDKSAIKDVGKVLGVPYEERNKMTKQLGDMSIALARETGQLKEWFEKYPKLFEYAEGLADTPKSFGVHPCFTKGHMIKTDNNYKPVEDIVVGDKVLTHKNNYKEVIDAFSHEVDDLHELKVMGSETITTTSTHPFYARKKIEKKTYSIAEWIDAKNLVRGDVLGVPVNSESEFPENSYSFDMKNHDFWWVAGRFLGDGWATKIKDREETRVEICCNKNNDDLSIILERYKSIGVNYRVVEKETSYNIISQDKNLYEFFINFGKYAYGKKIPDFVLNLPKEYLKSFLDGYLSADGHLNKDNYYHVCTVSKELQLGLSKCIHKVYETFVGVNITEPRKMKIEGRDVDCKKRYNMYFKTSKSKLDKTFVEDGYMWVRVLSNEQLNKQDTVYNITVLDDESYTVENLAVHNCAKVAFNNDVQWHMPVAQNGDTIVLQGDMHDAEDLGATKTDILGLKSLDIIYDTIDLVGLDDDFISPEKLDYSDEKVLDIYRKGQTVGIFQFESAGMRETLRKMNPDGIEDLGVANALFRPSSIKFIDHYAKRKSGEEKVEYLHPDLEEILGETYGIWVFQEQMISLAKLSGMKSPDTIRKAIGKKLFDLMEKSKDELFDGLRARGWNEEQLAVLWQDMIDYSSYSFNKSHSSAYAILSFQMAKLKAYYPLEFMVSTLNNKLGKREELSIYVNECEKMGIKILPPDINKSDALFKIEDGAIRFGLLGIKAVGEPTIDTISKVRGTLQMLTDGNEYDFASVKDFYETSEVMVLESQYTNSEGNVVSGESMISKDAFINLVKSGAFGLNRNELLLEYAKLTYEPLIYKERMSLPMRGDFRKIKLEISEEDYKDKSVRHKIFTDFKYQEYLKKDEARKQKHINEFKEKYIGNEKFYDFDVMSCYISMSPFDNYIGRMKDFYEYKDGDSKILIMGTILDKEVKKSGRGGQYAKLSVVSPFGVYQGKAFSQIYAEYKDILDKGQTVVMLVKRSKDEFIISKMITFSDWKANIKRKAELKKKREARLNAK